MRLWSRVEGFVDRVDGFVVSTGVEQSFGDTVSIACEDCVEAIREFKGTTTCRRRVGRREGFDEFFLSLGLARRCLHEGGGNPRPGLDYTLFELLKCSFFLISMEGWLWWSCAFGEGPLDEIRWLIKFNDGFGFDEVVRCDCYWVGTSSEHGPDLGGNKFACQIGFGDALLQDDAIVDRSD